MTDELTKALDARDEARRVFYYQHIDWFGSVLSW